MRNQIPMTTDPSLDEFLGKNTQFQLLIPLIIEYCVDIRDVMNLEFELALSCNPSDFINRVGPNETDPQIRDAKWYYDAEWYFGEIFYEILVGRPNDGSNLRRPFAPNVL